VGWAAFLREAAPAEIDPLLAQVQSGRSRPAKLVLALLRRYGREAPAFQKALEDWLKHYRKEEFPKEKVTKKITLKGHSSFIGRRKKVSCDGSAGVCGPHRPHSLNRYRAMNRLLVKATAAGWDC